MHSKQCHMLSIQTLSYFNEEEKRKYIYITCNMRNRVHDTTTWHQCLLLLLLSKKYPHLPSFGPAATLYLNLSHLNFCIVSLYKTKKANRKESEAAKKVLLWLFCPEPNRIRENPWDLEHSKATLYIKWLFQNFIQVFEQVNTFTT